MSKVCVGGGVDVLWLGLRVGEVVWVSFHFNLAVKPMTFRKADLITILVKNPMERRQLRRKFQFKMWEENPQRIVPGKTHAVR